MIKIFKFYEKINFDDQNKLFKDIVYECIHDFFWKNFLTYHINFDIPHKLLTQHYTPRKLKELIPDEKIDNPKHAYAFRIIKIVITRKNQNITDFIKLSKGGITEDRENEYNNCISHLKHSLEKEFDIVKFNAPDLSLASVDDTLYSFLPKNIIEVIYGPLPEDHGLTQSRPTREGNF